MTALLEAGAGVGWPDHDAAAKARRSVARPGRFADVAEWLAGVQGRFPAERPRRVRAVLLNPITDAVAELAAAREVGLRHAELDADPAKAFAQGIDLVDREIDEGADLLVLAGRDETNAADVLISVLTGAEPVALLPRGADAVDTDRWIAAAEELRDSRREVALLRSRPDALLAGLGSSVIAAAAGCALHAAVRQTAVLLDGLAVLAAALLCIDCHPRARDWWQLADTSGERAAARGAEQLERTPLLSLGASTGDGAAGLLAVDVVRTALITGAVDA